MGLKKAFKKVKKLAKKIAAPALSIAGNALLPGLGGVLGGALGGAIGGGGVKGAVLGGLGGYALNAAGGVGGILDKIKSGGLGGALDLAGNVIGGISALDQGKNANAIEREANPFGAYRPMYGAQLAMNMADPSAFANDPAYKFAMDQGLEAVSRKMAAGGYGDSGNMATALAQYGSGLAMQYRGQEMDRLAQLAGAGIMPASRASATTSRDSSFDQLSSILASIGYGTGRAANDDEEELAPIIAAGSKMTRPSSVIPW